MAMTHCGNYDGLYGYDLISVRLYHPLLWGSKVTCSLLSQLYWWWLRRWQWCWFIVWWWWWCGCQWWLWFTGVFHKHSRGIQEGCQEDKGGLCIIFRRLLITYNRCQVEAEQRMDTFPDHILFLEILQRIYQEDEQRIQHIKAIDE